MRLRLLLSVIVLSMAVVWTGCDKKDDAAKPEKKAEAKPEAKKAEAKPEAKKAEAKPEAKKAEAKPEAIKKIEAAAGKELAKVAELKDGAQALAKDGKGLTLEQYEQLMLTLASCKVNERGIDRECAQFKSFNEKRKNRSTAVKDWGGGMAALGRKHIGHESPAVRLQAAKLTASVFGADAKSQGVLVDAAKVEKNAVVLRHMIRSVGSSVKKNAAVLELLMKGASHEDEKVRTESASWLTSTFAAGTEGTLEKAIEMVEKDPSEKVRKYICSRLGNRADDRAFDVLKKYTADPENPLYDSCFAGVVGMWSSPVPHKAPSQKGYELTLELLKAKPRSEKCPPWNRVGDVNWAAKEEFQKAASWFKMDDLLGALEEVVMDRDAKWMARTGAVKSMLKLGAPKASFERMAKGYADAASKPGTDKHVHKAIEEAMGKAK